jgi:uncharacterized membrane protein
MADERVRTGFEPIPYLLKKQIKNYKTLFFVFVTLKTSYCFIAWLSFSFRFRTEKSSLFNSHLVYYYHYYFVQVFIQLYLKNTHQSETDLRKKFLFFICRILVDKQLDSFVFIV